MINYVMVSLHQYIMRFYNSKHYCTGHFWCKFKPVRCNENFHEGCSAVIREKKHFQIDKVNLAAYTDLVVQSPIKCANILSLIEDWAVESRPPWAKQLLLIGFNLLIVFRA